MAIREDRFIKYLLLEFYNFLRFPNSGKYLSPIEILDPLSVQQKIRPEDISPARRRKYFIRKYLPIPNFFPRFSYLPETGFEGKIFQSI
jgi:hypothetical protein